MIFQRNVLSDEDYVEQIRKNIRTFRRMQWWWVLLFIGLMCALLGFGEMVQKFAATMPTDKVMYHQGLVMGALFGFIFVCTAAQAVVTVKQWWDARYGFRTERLLLQCYDQLNGRSISPSRIDHRGAPRLD